MIPGTSAYTDFRSLNQLEANARERSPEATREAGAVFAEDRDRTYEEMFDQQIALELTREKGLGLADMLVRQLGGMVQDDTRQAVDQGRLSERMDARRPSPAEPAPVQAVDVQAANVQAVDERARQDFQPDGPESFLREIWPLAQRAAEALGVDVRAIAAQAALETGWGQHLIRDAEGVSGNNLFGIKADVRWDGERVAVSTLEYADGVAKRERAEFRAYPDLESGFNDYVNFLRDNPRYSDATRGNLSGNEFATSLQAAGYATDPGYARKIGNIMDSSRFARVESELKNGGEVPTKL